MNYIYLYIYCRYLKMSFKLFTFLIISAVNFIIRSFYLMYR